MKGLEKRIKKFFSILEEIESLVAVKRALVEIIPIIMIGAFSLMFRSMPIDGYQAFILSWGNGIIDNILKIAYDATFGMLSVYMALSLSYHMTMVKNVVRGESRIGWISASVMGFFIMSGFPGRNLDPLGPKGMFTAIFAVMLATHLFSVIEKKTKIRELMAKGIEIRMGRSLQLVLPTLFVVLVLTIFEYGVVRIFDVDSVYHLIQKANELLFVQITNDTIRGLVFVVISSMLWFFGIHGSDVLDGVVDTVFVPATGQVDTIITRPFWDNFILMGGCGATICLFVAILFFSKKNSTRSLGRMAFVPAVFNINEIFIYGLPIIFNPFLVFPFILVPLVCFITTYVSMRIGLVPPAIHPVGWTTPVLVSGYLATNSFQGMFLQLFNIAIGTAIYVPFVRLYEKYEIENSPKDYNKMLDILRDAENRGARVNFSEDPAFCLTAKALIADLKAAIKRGELILYYQPQIHESGESFGAEALLRWKHNVLGYIYPPMIIELASEAGILEELERWIIKRVLLDAKAFSRTNGLNGKKVSVNVTGQSIQSQTFEEFLLTMAKEYDVKHMNVCIEITEQAAIQMNDFMGQRFARLRQAGYSLAVDDFSMGSTSIKYLTSNNFNIIKLDGYLVKDIVNNSRCYEIISHITALSKSLDVEIIAEYVSNKKIQEKLLEAGCTIYQGWYYAMPAPKEEYISNYGNSDGFMIK